VAIFKRRNWDREKVQLWRGECLFDGAMILHESFEECRRRVEIHVAAELSRTTFLIKGGAA
jgi:hypothetical protein